MGARNLSLVSGPASFPITKEEAKLHLRYENDEEDSLITTLISAVVDNAENFTRRRFISQTWKMFLDDFPREDEKSLWPGTILLPYPPCISVTHVKYYDSSGALQTLSSSTDYLALTEDTPARIVPAPDQIWPTVVYDRPDAVEVQFVCGYTDANSVPAPIKQALLILLAHWFENRQETSPVMMHQMPLTAEHLLWPFRDFRCD